MNNVIKQRYLNKFDELNVLVFEHFDTITVKKFEELLVDAYIEGFLGAKYILEGDTEEPSTKSIMDALNKEYDGVSISKKAEQYINDKDISAFNTLLTSEYHRVYNQGSFDYAKKNSKKSKGINKRWVAVMDDKTRDTHFFLNGQTIPMDAYFYSFDGDKALMPSGFEKVENNVNCRCILDYIKV